MTISSRCKAGTASTRRRRGGVVVVASSSQSGAMPFSTSASTSSTCGSRRGVRRPSLAIATTLAVAAAMHPPSIVSTTTPSMVASAFVPTPVAMRNCFVPLGARQKASSVRSILLDPLETATASSTTLATSMPMLSLRPTLASSSSSTSLWSSASRAAESASASSGSATQSPGRRGGGSGGSGSVGNKNRNNNKNRKPRVKFSSASGSGEQGDRPPRRRRRKKYQRKRQKPETERRSEKNRRERQAKYELLRRRAASQGGDGKGDNGDDPKPPSLWSFEALFPAPVWDDQAVQRDLYEVKERDGQRFLSRLREDQGGDGAATGEKEEVGRGNGLFSPKLDEAVANRMKKVQSASLLSSGGAPAEAKARRDVRLLPRSLYSNDISYKCDKEAPPPPKKPDSVSLRTEKEKKDAAIASQNTITWGTDARQEALAAMKNNANATDAAALGDDPISVDPALTRMVEDRLYGFRRTSLGDFQYDTSLMGDGAVRFRDGVRLGNPLKVNADLLNFHAKKDMSHGRLEEAEELYEQAIEIDPRDGRAYLGLSRIAQRRRDFAKARECLRAGIANSVADQSDVTGMEDTGPNPFLLQALGCLEERVGSLSEAEALYVASTRSRPSHAASWVALAQLRTRKLRMGAAAGRACYRAAERELRSAGLPPSAHVYTAWAALEDKKAGDYRRARELFERALEIDPRCSAARLQLGVMEAGRENWDEARETFESALKYDKKNSRILQAYAIMESRRPEGDSREVIGLFERALRAKPRDAGVLQAYALYVAKLGDVDAARDLLRRGTEVDKRHAAVWQAWGVLETRHGTAQTARDVFQQGIWACAQSGGGQSGGRRCARLWQAWGVLESREEDYAAARRCFSRALDADRRSVAAVTAWTVMEESLGRFSDARSIFERALKQLPPSSEEKMAVWRAYELMEQKAGNENLAQQVYQRSMRETIMIGDDFLPEGQTIKAAVEAPKQARSSRDDDESILKTGRERGVEVFQWKTDGVMGGGGEVWLNNDGSIEGKVPASAMKKSNEKKKKEAQRQQQQEQQQKQSQSTGNK